MKKSSVLIRRAALLTAIAMAIAVAVGMSVLIVMGAGQASGAARQGAKAQALALADGRQDRSAGARDGRIASAAAQVEALGGMAWQADDRRAVWALAGEGADEALSLAEPGILGALEGDGQSDRFTLSGVRYAFFAAPLSEGGGAVAVALPVNPPPLAPALAAGAAGAIAALLAAWLLAPRVMTPALEPVARLRDAAVAMAGGELDTRADEQAYGELGELGKAVNNLSDQLSSNMYMLIVERNRLRNMLNGLSEGIVAIDRDGAVTHTNPALEKFFPRQKQPLLDPRMKLIPDSGIWEDFDGVIRSGEPATRTMQARDMTLRLTITPIVDEIGTIAGAVGLFSDITQMERLERTRREYVSNVSHELRSPLTAMRALVEPLSEGMVTEEADRRRYYDIILQEITRLTRLINDQLELSRLQSGNTAIEKRQISLDEVVCDVCDRFNAVAARKGLELKVDTDFTQCPPVFSNIDRVEQLLVILVDNAIKYTEAGGVSVSADWDDERVVIHVSDTGVGIGELDLPYVFDRFYKVDKAHSGKMGSGLGLSIARELLSRMDEQIWVESEKDKGTRFSFTLHRRARDDADTEKTE